MCKMLSIVFFCFEHRIQNVITIRMKKAPPNAYHFDLNKFMARNSLNNYYQWCWLKNFMQILGTLNFISTFEFRYFFTLKTAVGKRKSVGK